MPIIVSNITSTLEYTHADCLMEAYIARPSDPTPKPVVFICHAWAGRNKFAEEVANRLANLGYIGVALDVYGKGKLGKNKEENMALMQPLLNDRALLQARLITGIAAVEQLAFVKNTKMVVMGYCFGGLCALDLARMNINLKGAVSVHGLLNQPANLKNIKTNTKILSLHGHLDPMVTIEDIKEFMQEMDDRGADWQFITYGKAMHAFTDPAANDYDFGTVYEQSSAERSWGAIVQFLVECFRK